jgi:hypothetical protein
VAEAERRLAALPVGGAPQEVPSRAITTPV